jgi:hypothetical protein
MNDIESQSYVTAVLMCSHLYVLMLNSFCGGIPTCCFFGVWILWNCRYRCVLSGRFYSGRKITESFGNVTVRGEKDGKGKGGARLSTVCLSMYSITENIYYSQLSSVAILLQPETVFTSYNTKDWVLSAYVLSPCGLALPSTCLLVTVNEARSYFASTVSCTISAPTSSVLTSRTQAACHRLLCLTANVNSVATTARLLIGHNWHGSFVSLRDWHPRKATSTNCCKLSTAVPPHHGGAFGERIHSSYSLSGHFIGWVSVTPRPSFTPGKGPTLSIVQEAV